MSYVFVSSILFWFPQCTRYFWCVFPFLFLEHKQDSNVTSVKNVQGCFWHIFYIRNRHISVSSFVYKYDQWPHDRKSRCLRGRWHSSIKLFYIALLNVFPSIYQIIDIAVKIYLKYKEQKKTLSSRYTCKIMEHIIVSIMMDHSVQPSTWILIIKIMWNSVSFIQELAKNNNNIQTDIIVMDFGKTLDKVPHKRLLSKLNQKKTLSSRYTCMFSYHPFYFDFHSARVIFDVSSRFYFWNINRTPTWQPISLTCTL
jgi:hypothetical protein